VVMGAGTTVPVTMIETFPPCEYAVRLVPTVTVTAAAFTRRGTAQMRRKAIIASTPIPIGDVLLTGEFSVLIL